MCSLLESFDLKIGQRPLGDGMTNLLVISASLPLGQIGVDFDIPQSNLVGLQVDFGNQKSNRYARGNRRIFRICEPIYGSQNAKLSDAKLTGTSSRLTLSTVCFTVSFRRAGLDRLM